MDTMYERCCGLDIHKKTIEACFRSGKKKTHMSFGTTSAELRKLTMWLVENDCQSVAMESTGSYWKPIFNILELSGTDMKIIVVNSRHMKNVPGRKTDVNDAEWIAELLQYGLLRPSFIPDREQRELRELSRYRKSLVGERAREINRLQKMPEGGNIKLTSVVSEVTGYSSRRLLDRLLRNDEPMTEDVISGLVHTSLAGKSKELETALDGLLSELQKELLIKVLDHIDDISRRIADLDDFCRKQMKKYEDALDKLDEIPGIARRTAETILIETGLDMSRFPTAKHFARWAGLAPGNNESAGKRSSGRTTKGNPTLKSTLIQSAKVAARKKNSFFKARYQKIAARRGANRASVAVAHSMLIAIYHILKFGERFKDLREDYYNQFNREKKKNYYLKKLTKLGVNLKEATLSISIQAAT